MFIPIISHREIKSILTYVPTTGNLIWTHSRGRIKAGTKAGTVKNGELWVRVASRLMKARDVIYFYMTGRWASCEAIDGDARNLRWDNIAVRSAPEDIIKKDCPYLYLSKSDGAWVVDNNMGFSINDVLQMLQIDDQEPS